MLSLLAVFLDILPGYRIRPPTEKEKEMNVRQEGRGDGAGQSRGAAGDEREAGGAGQSRGLGRAGVRAAGLARNGGWEGRHCGQSIFFLAPLPHAVRPLHHHGRSCCGCCCSRCCCTLPPTTRPRL